MAHFFVDLIFWLEVAVSFVLVVSIFFSLIYLSLSFVEERISLMAKMGQTMTVIALILSLILSLSNYGKLAFITSFLENLAWFIVFNQGFPFINIVSPVIFAGIAMTLIAHVSWIFSFVSYPTSTAVALFIYLFLIWGIPVLMVMMMPSVFDENGNLTTNITQRTSSRSIWATLIPKWIEKLKSILPHSTGHLD